MSTIAPGNVWPLTSSTGVRGITFDAARGIWNGAVGSNPVFTILTVDF